MLDIVNIALFNIVVCVCMCVCIHAHLHVCVLLLESAFIVLRLIFKFN